MELEPQQYCLIKELQDENINIRDELISVKSHVSISNLILCRISHYQRKSQNWK